ncbi:unnamed protein product, partial [Nesidiocoris tenuis]
MNLEKRTISELPYVLIPKSNLKILIDTGSTKSYCNPTIAENFFQNKIRKEPFIVKTAHGSSRGNFTTLVPCVIEEKNKDREDLPAIPPEVYVKTVQKQSKTKPKYNKEIIKTVDHELKTAQIIPRHHNTKEKIHLSNIRRPKKFSESVINAWDDTLDRSEVLTKKFGLNITREDLLTLRESNWLNDKIINFYMELIDQRSRQNHKLPTTFSFNTFLYVSLKAGGYSRVKNYTRKTDLFEKDIVFIPIFKAAHWRLITIYIKLQKIEYLDSLGKDGTDILEDIKNYLTEEHNHKKGTPLDTTNWKFTQRTDIPLQQNNDDCGVFVCQYAKSLGSSEEIQIKHSQIPEAFSLNEYLGSSSIACCIPKYPYKQQKQFNPSISTLISITLPEQMFSNATYHTNKVTHSHYDQLRLATARRGQSARARKREKEEEEWGSQFLPASIFKKELDENVFQF